MKKKNHNNYSHLIRMTLWRGIFRFQRRDSINRLNFQMFWDFSHLFSTFQPYQREKKKTTSLLTSGMKQFTFEHLLFFSFSSIAQFFVVWLGEILASKCYHVLYLFMKKLNYNTENRLSHPYKVKEKETHKRNICDVFKYNKNEKKKSGGWLAE